MLCLTVYESKGLEFNDVIIYNFFDDSETSSNQWKALNDLMLSKIQVPIIDESIMDFDSLDI